ncbi:retrotransposon protein, putative, ty1-copia subclass [Tanacetum coccineum]|uniref:Retrotransposon protein, putative, ty1-copia subclass n=1 Tax=Tanacetum coccineum TaxID=301880 RepID=A0ABQ5EJY2_9ASTR
MQERLDLNKTQGASTPKEVKRMQNVPYASAVGKPHWTVVKTILKYLRNTKDMFLVYGRNPEVELRVDYYCNAGFETDRDEIKSQTGYVYILNGRRSRLEKLQAKYYWLGIVPTINEPIKMFCDDSTALLIANEPGVQKSARHYHRRYLLKVHTYENLADPFTKALPKRKLTQHARSMGLQLYVQILDPPCNPTYVPAKMWCYTRLAYMAMSYLYRKQFFGPITPVILQLRDELYAQPNDEIKWRSVRNLCTKVKYAIATSNIILCLIEFLSLRFYDITYFRETGDKERIWQSDKEKYFESLVNV